MKDAAEAGEADEIEEADEADGTDAAGKCMAGGVGETGDIVEAEAAVGC